MTRRTPWPVQEDSGGLTSSRAEAGPPRKTRKGRGRSPGSPPRTNDELSADDREGEERRATGAGGDEAAYYEGAEYGGAEHEDADVGTGGAPGLGDRPGAGGEASDDGAAAPGGDPAKDPVEQARAVCLRLLTGTPRTRRQLADALRKREIPDEAAEEVLSRFEEVGLIDDAAFADAWVESRHHSRGLARRALARELRTKGVDSHVIEDAVGQLDADREAETARALVDGKLRSTRGLDREKRIRRLAGMLARRGYGEGLALRIVRQALEEEGEDPETLDRYLPDG